MPQMNKGGKFFLVYLQSEKMELFKYLHKQWKNIILLSIKKSAYLLAVRVTADFV